MFERINARLGYLRSALNRPIPKLLSALLAVASVYDLFLSQFLPPEVSQDMPRAWQMLAGINDYMPNLPPLGWVALWAAFVAGVSIEYGMERRGHPDKKPNQPPMVDISAEHLGLRRKAAASPADSKPKYALPKE